MAEVKLFQMGHEHTWFLVNHSSLHSPLNSRLACFDRNPADVSVEAFRTAVTAEARTPPFDSTSFKDTTKTENRKPQT